MTITKELLHQLFEYRDGNLYRIKTNVNRTKVGQPAGNPDTGGYLRTSINYKEYRVHRLIFLYHHGWLPEFIDHIDCNPSNNRIENLREATRQQNIWNRKARNKTGCKNVYYDKQKRRYKIRMAVNGKKQNFGSYKNFDTAKSVADELRLKFHGKFANNQ